MHTEKGWEAVDEVPLLGRIAAGRGLEAIAMNDEAYFLTRDLLFSRSGRRRYILRVKGDSMTGARIEGDYILDAALAFRKGPHYKSPGSLALKACCSVRACGIRARDLRSRGCSPNIARLTLRQIYSPRIENGDLLVVEEDEDPPDGTIVVALLRNGEEVTVKRFYREGEIVRLKPDNGEQENIVLLAEEVRIQGRVVSVVYHPAR